MVANTFGKYWQCNHYIKSLARDYHTSALLLVIVVFLISSCTRIQLTPITTEPTGVHYPGQIVWHDLITDDVESAKDFYGTLFEWKFQQYKNYTLARNGSRPIAGIVQLKNESDERSSSGWIPYFSISDVDDTTYWIQSVGGKILKGPGEMGKRGRYATVADPLGAPIVVLRSKDGDPHEKEIRPGDWLWDELWTSDVEAALDFYQRLGNYAAEQIDTDGTGGYWVLLDNQERYQSGITKTPFDGLPSQWVPVIRVGEPMDVANRAVSLGGEVIIQPNHPLSNGRIALIKDPVGGIFMVEKWETGN